MFTPLFNGHTNEARCVESPLEYHKLQFLNVSNSAHIWIPSWQTKIWKELQNQTRSKRSYPFFLMIVAKVVKKFEVQGVR